MSGLATVVANRSSRRFERESWFRHPKRGPSKTRFQNEKVRTIRKQIAEGTYDFNGHLDTVVDRLFKALTQE